MIPDVLNFTWIGVDNTRWPFGECGIDLSKTPQGLGGAAFTHLWQNNARQLGRTWKGMTNEHMEIVFDIIVRSGRTESFWREFHSTWRDSLGRGDRKGTFLVTSAERGHWWADARLGQAIQTDDWQKPGVLGEASERIVLFSDFTFWRGVDEVRTFNVADLFAPTRMQNRGDQPVWLKYELTGPGQWHVGVDGEVVSLPRIGPGQKLLVDTDIEDPRIHLGSWTGESMWGEMGDQFFFKKAPATPLVDLHLVCDGGINGRSKATVTLSPLRERAW
ncbi:hypothetical protein [Rhodococcus ruber]|uniref:hypothetical protein n=1 Tax=Rhodococcus ruber TaxID=1830 RepID=UPI0037836D94